MRRGKCSTKHNEQPVTERYTGSTHATRWRATTARRISHTTTSRRTPERLGEPAPTSTHRGKQRHLFLLNRAYSEKQNRSTSTLPPRTNPQHHTAPGQDVHTERRRTHRHIHMSHVSINQSTKSVNHSHQHTSITRYSAASRFPLRAARCSGVCP